jgi:CheY-like chemotaxis protein
MELESIGLEVREVVVDAARILAVAASRKGLELICNVAPEVPTRLVGDPVRLRQIVTNLVGNAIKFTEKGEICVEMQLLRQEPTRVALRCGVRDSGIGIPHDKQQSVFEAFKQTDSSITRRFGGTGLGLAITAELVALMGGKIWVESEPGMGSTFWFDISLALPAEEAAPLPAAKKLSGKTAVLLSANRQARLAHAAMLEEAGLKVQAIDPAASENLAGELAGADVVIVDESCANPIELDSLEQSLADRSKRPPLVVLAPAGRTESFDRCQRLAIEHCLTKPVKGHELSAAIGAAIDAGQGEAEKGNDAQSDAARALYVLVADDSPVNQQVAAGLLELRGHRVALVSNGREAVEAWQAEPFDAVLMDVEMPEMDGMAATRRIRELEADGPRHTPIFALSAHAMKGIHEQCLAAGMDGYVSKPLQPAELFSTLESIGRPPATLKGLELAKV